MTDETYLGDAVYASFDGYQIWLRTCDNNDHRIALEPPVLDALFQFVETLKSQAEERVKLQLLRDLPDKIEAAFARASGEQPEHSND